jgi:hypothetical protein
VSAQRPRGRAVPSRARLAAAYQICLEHAEPLAALAATLPRTVRLNDGRALARDHHTGNGAGYRAPDGLRVLVSFDPTPHGILRHLSCSYADHDPTWQDLKLLRAAFFPADQDVIQVLPRDGAYINDHQHCFHLFESPAAWQGGLFV